MYSIQKDYLTTGQTIFPEDFEAWGFGAVVPEVYYNYCHFGCQPIIPLHRGTTIELSKRERIIVDSTF